VPFEIYNCANISAKVPVVAEKIHNVWLQKSSVTRYTS